MAVVMFPLPWGRTFPMRMVLSGGPWDFDRQLHVLVKPTGIREISNMDFSHASFWIQVHNAPLACMTRKVALFLGEPLGSVEDVELMELGDYDRKFLHLSSGKERTESKQDYEGSRGHMGMASRRPWGRGSFRGGSQRGGGFHSNPSFAEDDDAITGENSNLIPHL
ncbi:hypothetical protein Sjap_003447 [Stephania japonica]|uniref:DUF4283 domain-containing protein n=1 Tax=Stephania japonica TaxID=461633 RepID=A0AAP0KNS3_9MAGN